MSKRAWSNIALIIVLLPIVFALNYSLSPRGTLEDHETWPLLGYRVKVTDSLLVLFTFLLWYSTRALVKGAEDTAQRQLRAYVFIHTVDIANVAAPIAVPGNPPIEPTAANLNFPQRGPIAPITIKNSGQTPAYDVVNKFNMVFREFPLIGELPPIVITNLITKSLIAPGAITSANPSLPTPLTSAELNSLRAGTHAIYVYGEIAYSDAFGVRRITNYRYLHGAVTGAIGISTQMTICDVGNDAT